MSAMRGEGTGASVEGGPDRVDRAQFMERTKQVALRVLKLSRALPRTVEGKALAGQLVRAGTSVGANYRAACRARSRAEFIAKLGVVEEEADEVCFWLELIIEDGMLPEGRIQPLLREVSEIVAMVVASRRTARRKQHERAAHG